MNFCEESVIQVEMPMSLFDRGLDIILLRLYLVYSIIISYDLREKGRYIQRYLERKGASVILLYYDDPTLFTFGTIVTELKMLYDSACILFYGSTNDHSLLDLAMIKNELNEPEFHFISLTTSEDAILKNVRPFESIVVYTRENQLKENLDFLELTSNFLPIGSAVTSRMVELFEIMTMFIETLKINFTSDIKVLQTIMYNKVFTGPEGQILLMPNNLISRNLIIINYDENLRKFMTVYISSDMIRPLAWNAIGSDQLFNCDFIDENIGKKKRLPMKSILCAVSLTNIKSNIEMMMLNILEQSVKLLNLEGGIFGYNLLVDVNDVRNDYEEFTSILEFYAQSSHIALFGGYENEMFLSSSRIKEKIFFYTGLSQGDVCYENSITLHYDVQQAFEHIRYFLFMNDKPIYLIYSVSSYSTIIKRHFIHLITSYGFTLSGESNIQTEDGKSISNSISAAIPNGGLIMSTLWQIESNIEFFNSMCENDIRYPKYTIYSISFQQSNMKRIKDNCMYGHHIISSFFKESAFRSLNPFPIKEGSAEFVTHLEGLFGENINIESSFEAIYVGLDLWKQAVIQMGNFDSKVIRKFLYNKPISAPSGMVVLNPNNYLSRNIFTGQYDENNVLRIIHSSDSLIKPVSYSVITTPELQHKECDWSDENVMVNNKYKIIAFLHEKDSDHRKTELYRMEYQRVIIDDINRSGGILGHRIKDEHYFYDIESGEMTLMVRSIINQEDVIATIGCYAETCSDIVTQASFGYKKMFLSLARVTGNNCDPYTVFVSQPYFNYISTFISTPLIETFKNYFYISDYKYSNLEVLGLVVEVIATKKLSLDGSCILDFTSSLAPINMQLEKCYNDIMAKSLLYSIVVVVSIVGEKQLDVFHTFTNHKENMGAIKFLLFDYEPSIYDLAISDLLESSWVVNTAGDLQQSSVAKSFEGMLLSYFGDAFPVSSTAATNYDAIYLLKEAIEYASQYSTEPFPSSEYIRLSFLDLEIESIGGDLKINRNNYITSLFYLCEIINKNIKPYYPPDGTKIYILPEITEKLNPKCKFSKTSSIYSQQPYYSYALYGMLALNALLMLFSVNFILTNSEHPIVRSAPQTYLWLVLSSLFLVLVSSFISDITPTTDSTICWLRMGFLFFSVTLLINSNLYKVFKIYRLLSNRNLQKVKKNFLIR